jgi:UDP-N-acetylglucosamine pyrophosphorylase
MILLSERGHFALPIKLYSKTDYFMQSDLSVIEDAIRKKMTDRGIEPERIDCFVNDVGRVHQGESALIHENSIEPVGQLPSSYEINSSKEPSKELLKKLVVIKLNGGLGTGMGLNRAKSLIPVKSGLCFLDVITRQIQHLRQTMGIQQPLFQLMNSFVTQFDSLKHLSPMVNELGNGNSIGFLQGLVPKLRSDNLMPIEWNIQPSLEWAPPGHGDIYLSMQSSGILDRLLSQGIEYAFVSNADNLGASVSLELLEYFSQSEKSFMMEVSNRTSSDRKGGHLARRISDQRLILRESAQCPPSEIDCFQDISRHGYFNTNNLWFRLDHMKTYWERDLIGLQLPLIQNIKRVDPKISSSPEVIQLESAMGAAIECFDASCAVEVSRERFSPVKSTGDLLALRSDAYVMTPGHQLELHASRNGLPPVIHLDADYFRNLDDFELRFGQQVPSLLQCDLLKVDGPVHFKPGVVLQGKVDFINASGKEQTVQPGVYKDDTIHWA